MNDNSHETLHFGRGLNLARAEEALDRFDSIRGKVTSLSLDLQRIRHVDVGAAWRLGNGLRAASQNSRITTILEDGFEPTGRLGFQCYTHSGLGLALASYSHTVLSGSKDITGDFRDYYTNPRSTQEIPLQAWTASTLILVPDIHKGLLPAETATEFNTTFRTLLPHSKIDLRAYSQIETSALFQLVFEAVQNAWDHANKSPLPAVTKIQSYLALRYFKEIYPPASVSKEFSTYLERVHGLAHEKKEQEHAGFIEIVVSDDGVGIAARHSQTSEIYRGPMSDEILSLESAFSAGSSIKLRTTDATQRGAPGFGFPKIERALSELSGFALVRSGRAMAFLDGTSSELGFQLAEEPLGTLPGTVLQIVFPRRRAMLWNLDHAS